MCDFVLTSIPREYDDVFISGMGYHPKKLASDDWISSAYENDCSFLIVSGLWCSCGLLSNEIETPALEEADLKNIRQRKIAKLSKPKYRKQGWTADTIAREAELRVQAAHQNLSRSEYGLNRSFINYLEKLLTQIPRISLYIFEAPDSPEKIPLVQERQNLTISKLVNDPAVIGRYILYDIYG